MRQNADLYKCRVLFYSVVGLFGILREYYRYFCFCLAKNICRAQYFTENLSNLIISMRKNQNKDCERLNSVLKLDGEKFNFTYLPTDNWQVFEHLLCVA